jgi:hypothetical protein
MLPAVSGIPAAALAAVTDPNVRAVLEAVVDGWQVRNGAVGNGQQRFVTVGELGAVTGARMVGGLSQAIQGQVNRRAISPEEISQIITSLQSSVVESALFKELGERIRLIETTRLIEITGLTEELNEASQRILDIEDGVTDIAVVTPGGATSLRAIKNTVYDPQTGLAAATAAIGEINNLTLTSTSAAARQITTVAAQVNDPNTGLAQTNANITAINTVDASSTSASARQLAGLQATVTNPVTGLAAAHAAIVQLNTVSATSTSANARYLFGLTASIDQKNKVFFQTEPPGNTQEYSLRANDLWFDSNDENRSYRWTGSQWQESSDGRIAAATGLITNEATVRANQDNVLANAINTVWTAIGDGAALVQSGANGVSNRAGAVANQWNQVQATVKDPNTGQYIQSVAVRQEAQAASNRAGELEGKYTIKVDVNGYVSGFGLASTANNSTPFSEFIVRADRFAIGSPSGPGIAPAVPFIVQTTPTTLNGRTVNPGVYIDELYLRNGHIVNADIGLAQIDTLVIAGNAVTQPVVGNFPSVFSYGPKGTWTGPVARIWIDMGPGPVGGGLLGALIMFTYEHTQISGGIQALNFRIDRVGVTVGQGQSNHPNNSPRSTVTSFIFDNPPPGVTYYDLMIMEDGDVRTPGYVSNARMFVFGAKR